MTFKQWALHDEDDNREMRITFIRKDGSSIYYCSGEEISVRHMFKLQKGRVASVKLINNIWYLQIFES